MQERTSKLIRTFQQTRDIETMMSILIALHEEENVTERVSYKNCLRLLRNIAAHEPALFTSTFTEGYNKGAQKIVLTSADGASVVLDTVQLVVWMFDMYLKSKEEEYLIFIKAVYQLLYPKALERFQNTGKFVFWQEAETAVINPYYRWTTVMYEKCGMIRTFGCTDPYAMKLLKENPKVFWKMAIPSMADIACFYMSGCIDLRHEPDLKYFLMLYTLREGG